jgi:hypothetical protein
MNSYRLMTTKQPQKIYNILLMQYKQEEGELLELFLYVEYNIFIYLKKKTGMSLDNIFLVKT